MFISYTSLNENGLGVSFVLNTFPPSVVTDEVCVSFSRPGTNTLVYTAPSGNANPSSESSTTLYTTQFFARMERAVTLTRRHPSASHRPAVTRDATVRFIAPDLTRHANATAPPASAHSPSSEPATRDSGILR